MIVTQILQEILSLIIIITSVSEVNIVETELQTQHWRQSKHDSYVQFQWIEIHLTQISECGNWQCQQNDTFSVLIFQHCCVSPALSDDYHRHLHNEWLRSSAEMSLSVQDADSILLQTTQWTNLNSVKMGQCTKSRTSFIIIQSFIQRSLMKNQLMKDLIHFSSYASRQMMTASDRLSQLHTLTTGEILTASNSAHGTDSDMSSEKKHTFTMIFTAV